MRKIVILALYFSIGHRTAEAYPGRFSAEFSPSYSTNRVYGQTQPAIHDKGGASMHFGAAYHLTLQAYCSLSLGLSYALGHIEWVHASDGSTPSHKEQYLLRYMWLPVLCRFYTSELMIDTSIYLKLGLIPSIHLPHRSTAPVKPEEVSLVKKRPFGCFILLGGGIKYDFSLTNSLTLGLSYCWDLPGVMYKQNSNNDSVDYHCHNNFICFDFCCLF